MPEKRKDEEEREPSRKKKKEPGGDTAADTGLVNALDVDPAFFKDPLLGQSLGKCKIEKLLGDGRTSVVYRAHYKPLKRTVAVKVLQERMTKYPAVVRVFQQEGRAVAALDHENVVKIYDVGQDKGHHYLVLELLKGQDLLAHIEETEAQRLEVGEALEISRQAAAGLAAAHRKKLVHRDIKPQNLVIEPNGVLKIVDFGLAAEAEGAFAGGRLGTPHYMSPEVCKGENARTASDIYALGVTLFHMLVGHAPYSGRTTTEEIINDHLKGERLEPEKLCPSIPKPVGDLIRRMTRMDPAQRPTAKQVFDFISQSLTPEQLTTAKKKRVRAVRRSRRRQTSSSPALVVVGVVVLAIVAFLLLKGGGDDEPPKQPDPRPVAEKPKPAPVRTKKPEPKGIADKALAKEVKDLIDMARKEASRGNLQSALHFYQRVLVKAPEDSHYYAEAKKSAEALRKRIDAKGGGPKKGTRPLVSSRGSEEAFREYLEAKDSFRERLTRFDVKAVRTEMKALRDRMTEGSTERGVVDEALGRVRLLASLVSIMQARAASLPGEKAFWLYYDEGASDEVVVVNASAEGVELRDEKGESAIKPWAEIEISVRVAFLEAIRNEKSATETLWIAYFCQLAGDDRAETYFDFAQMLDGGADMAREVKALKKGD